MTEFYRDDWLTIYQGDARAVLPELASDSVDCIVTSPPYWGLRDYGTASWTGGSEDCDHKPSREELIRRAQGASTLGGGQRTTPDETMLEKEAARWARHSCPRCGSVRADSQLGLERTPEEYVANLVGVFRELRRVLKPSGTAWLNLGDSYASNWGMGAKRDSSWWSTRSGDLEGKGWGQVETAIPPNSFKKGRADGLKVKDLVGIPWRVAFALQADGWYLRSDIIWAKPNPMPESVTDRPTKAHEYLFLLTKSARYYYDADAVREALAGPLHAPGNKPEKGVVQRNDFGTERMEALWGNPAGRNLRSVWTIATRPYPGAHFAVFPPELPERCIKAGSPSGGVILDCFAGSGTTGMVANRLSRRAILIDLNGDYLKQQLKRNAQTPLGLGA